MKPPRVAVLYRTNSQSRLVEEALRRYGIKYTMVGGFSFYERAEIKDLLSYLRLVQNPHDSMALKRVINTPARGIGKTTLETLERLALETGTSTWDAIGQRDPPAPAAAARADCARELSSASSTMRTPCSSRTLPRSSPRTSMLPPKCCPKAASLRARMPKTKPKTGGRPGH